jgi:hypothetical protein
VSAFETPPDYDAAAIIKGARGEANAALKQADPNFNPMAGKSPAKGAPLGQAPGAPPPLPGENAPAPGPTIGKAPPAPPAPPGTPQPPPPMSPSDEPPNAPPPIPAEPAEDSSVFKGTGRVVFNHFMAGLSSIGAALAQTGTGMAMAEDPAHAQDTLKAGHDYINKITDEAHDEWIGRAKDQEAGGGAQILGGIAEGLAPMALGPAGAAVMVGSSARESEHSLELQGVDPGTAAKVGLGTAIATAAGLKISTAIPGLTKWVRASLQHMASGAVGNTVISTAQQALEKYILQDDGFKEAAKNIDPSDPGSILQSGIMGVIYGAINAFTHGGAKAKAGEPKPTPPPAPPAGPPGDENAPTPPPPPGPNAPAAVKTAGEIAGTPAPLPIQSKAPIVSSVPDHPSPESSKDLKAQIVDMNNKDTPRTGVLITKDTQTILAGSKDANAASVNGTLNQARTQGRTIEVATGTLILKNKAAAKAAQARLTAGEDPQAVIGSVTGAGMGKTPDMTTVVQGQTPSGAVAVEKTVAPADVPIAKADIEAQGHTAVVTTPEEAQARRIDEISKERNAPVQAGIMTTPGGKEVAVHVESGAPDGHVRVRALDADGEPSAHTVDVPSERVKVTKPTEEAAPKIATEALKEAPKPNVEPATKPAEEAAPVVPSTEGTAPPPAELQGERTDMTKSPEERALERERNAALRDREEGVQRTPETEIIPRNAAEREGETARRDAAEKPAPPTVVEKTAEGKSAINASEVPAESAPKPKLKAVKPMSGLDALPEALATHEQQEQIPSGQKFAAPIQERQDNAASFAMVLREAAKSAVGKAGPAAIERAEKAASAAMGLATKSKVATEKGQGTGHTKITALNSEMHKAARGLLGVEAKAGDETVVAPKAAELKAKIAKKAAKPAPKEGTIEPKVASGIKDVTDEAPRAKQKPEAVDPVRKRKAERLMSEYIGADEEDAPAVRAKIEQFVHEEMSDTYTPDEQRQVLHMLDDQRREMNPNAGKTQTMGEEWENTAEEGAHDLPTTAAGLAEMGIRRGGKEMLSRQSDTDLTKDAKVRLTSEWNRLGHEMGKSGESLAFDAREDSGRHVGAHELLDKIIGNTHTPILRTMLMALRAHMPDLPVYTVSKIQNLQTGQAFGEHAAGLFDPTQHTIQIQIQSGADAPRTLRTIIHEMWHAATMYELHYNRGGKLATELEHARQVLVERLKAMYSPQDIKAHQDFFAGEGPKPDMYKRSLYGITNVGEFAAEIMANDDFKREITNSESHTQPGENLNYGLSGGKPSLLRTVFHAIGKMFGVDDPALLKHVATLTERVAEKQHEQSQPGGAFHGMLDKTNAEFAEGFVRNMQEKFGANPMEAKRAFPAMMALREEPPMLHVNDSALRETVGEEPTKIARSFNWMMKNRGTDGVRTLVTNLKTVPQIFRDHRSDFGHADDPQNPLNRLQDVDADKNVILNKMGAITRPVAERWVRMSDADNKTMGQLMIDTTMYKIDPRLAADKQPASSQKTTGFAARLAEYQQRFGAMSDDAQKVYSDAADANKRMATEDRKVAVDTALSALTDTKLSDAQKSLLYSVRGPEEYDHLIGKDKLIDVGENNDKLTSSLKDFAGGARIEGPYFHLGRQGDFVVTATPKGTKTFGDRSKAEAFAADVNNLSPDSKGTVVQRGNNFDVDYTAKYVSMHESKLDAEAARDRMTAAGYDVGSVTQKTMGKTDSAMGPGALELISAAESKINRNGKDEGTEALVDSLRSALVQAMAARSAYAGSRLARQNFGGVKAEDMRRNFAEHAASSIWHQAQLKTVFDHASALASLRDMARDKTADQNTAYRRGEVVQALNKHLQNEVASYGQKSALSAGLAKGGFMAYLASTAHAFIWMTQNFSTGIPRGAALYGMGKSVAAHTAGMRAVVSPAFAQTMREVFSLNGNASNIHDAIIKAVRLDPAMGKWAKGENSPLQQLIDRGVIKHGYANELGAMAKGDSAITTRVFDWARLLPSMADSFNRVSSALAGLEMTGGDIRKTGDFVDEVHADYSQEAKPLIFKQIAKVPGGSALTMFTTYRQAMIHLFYGNMKASITGTAALVTGKGNPELAKKTAIAAKTAAGMIASNILFAGVYGGAAIEPVKLALYAYHKLFDKEGEVYDLKNQIHRFLVDHMGKTAGDVAAGGLPRLLGADLSSRMGLSDLFLHEPPDLLSADPEMWKNFAYEEAGPMMSLIAHNVGGFVGHMQKGEPFQALSSIIPVKQYQDTVKAHELWSTGKENSLGGQMTKPSAFDAATQAFGIKPASVADAQERAGTIINYKRQVEATKTSILKAWVSSPDKRDAQARINNFNSLHPAEAIKPTDQIKMMRAKQASTSSAPGRDQTLNRMLNY